MDTREGNWRISTSDGVSLHADELIGVLGEHHRRLVTTWRGFTPAHWDHQTRNADWTVHQTVRHVADGMDRVAAAVHRVPVVDASDFDPRSTPDVWLTASAGESPIATIDRFESAAAVVRAGVRDRLASGDETHDPTVYGAAHWTLNVAHVLWDSWLHERDVLLPLGQPAVSSEEEERLVGLYGLMMALVPSMMSDRSISTTVRLIGVGDHTIEASCEAGSVVSAEAPTDATRRARSMPTAIDALAGRGEAVADALPGAPVELGILAALFTS